MKNNQKSIAFLFVLVFAASLVLSSCNLNSPAMHRAAQNYNNKLIADLAEQRRLREQIYNRQAACRQYNRGVSSDREVNCRNY